MLQLYFSNAPTLPGFRLLEYEQPGSVNPAKHCQVGDNLLQEEEGHPVIERSSYNNLYFPSYATCGTFCTCTWHQVRLPRWQERDSMSGEKFQGGFCFWGWWLSLGIWSIHKYTYMSWQGKIVDHGKNDVQCFRGALVCCFNGVRDRIYAGLFRWSIQEKFVMILLHN